jgi:hypothetical protein
MCSLYDTYMPLWHPGAFLYRFEGLAKFNMLRVARLAKHGFKYFRFHARKPMA